MAGGSRRGQGRGGRGRGGQGGRSANQKGGHRSRQEQQRKEFFLGATCKFVVHEGAVKSPSSSFRLASDPDALPDWDDVLQVGMFSHGQSLHCPVCLRADLVAPQTTLCAHVFCLPCILRHLMLHDGGSTAQPCPLCYFPVRVSDLRPASLRSVPLIRPGDVPRFRLLARRKDAAVPLEIPSSGTLKREECLSPQPWPLATSVNGWSALAKISVAENVEDFVYAEVDDLETLAEELRAERTHESHDELCWVLHALDLSRQRGFQWAERRASALGAEPPNPARFAPGAMGSPASEIGAHDPRPEPGSAASAAIQQAIPVQTPALSETEWPPLPTKGAQAEIGNVPSGEERNANADEPEVLGNDADAEDKAVSPLPSGPESSVGSKKTASLGPPALADGGKEADAGAYFFYWHNAGLTLAQVNIRVLLSEFGHYSRFPASITAEIVDVEEEILNEDTRKRLKHLAHLPLTTVIRIVELDLRGLVSEETLKVHASELAQRQKSREKRKQLERKHDENIRKQQEREARSKGPSAEELSAMPTVSAVYSPPQTEAVAGEDFPTPERSATQQHNQKQKKESGSGTLPAWGVSFARVANMG